MLPKKIYLNYADENNGERIFGVRIFCEEPLVSFNSDMKSCEYTNLSQVWHSSGEEPKCKELLIIYCNDIGGIPIDTLIYHGSVDYPWKELVKTTGIIYWAYAKDILPKVGEK